MTEVYPFAPFHPDILPTKKLLAAETTNSVTLSANSESLIAKINIRIANAGPNTAFLRYGSGPQTAELTDMPILAGTVEMFTKEPRDNTRGQIDDTFAAICASGQTATIYITCGRGE